MSATSLIEDVSCLFADSRAPKEARNYMNRKALCFSVICLSFAMELLIAGALLPESGSPGLRTVPAEAGHLTPPNVECSSFVVSGDPRSANGASWTYRSTDLGVRYVMEGVLFLPSG